MTLAEAPTTTRRRRIGGWVVIVAVLAGVGLIGAIVSAALQWSQRDALDPESAGPRGTQALASVLADHGVAVQITRTRASALAALAGHDAALVLADSPYLSDAAFAELTDAATDVVVIDPASRAARVLFPGAVSTGYGSDRTVQPSCDLPDAQRAGAVVAGALFTAPDAVTGCYGDEDGYALLIGEHGAGRAAVVDGTGIFTNEQLADNGNAALAVNLLGSRGTLVWYVGSIDDSDLSDTDPSLGDLTPGWVSPVIVVLLCAGLAAAIWRGRRFGPLVAENLPVTVRAAETTEGRARLYARSHDALHAADQLRMGALGRIARLVGLGPAASAAEISDAAAARLEADRARIRGILLDDIPRTDAELLALGDRIRDLEAAVRPSTGSGTDPTGSGADSTRSGTERNNL